MPFDDFKASEAASRALDEWEADVRARITVASASHKAKTTGRDADDLAALLELEREGWLAAADPAARYVDRECPACGSSGFVVLEVEYVDGAEYAHVHRFFCVACLLDLGFADWSFAGMADTYSDPDPAFFD